MRIIAGSARGRRLKGPTTKGVRPTSDRARETLFNILGQWMEGFSVLDLYAGTGAMALEALSRGAQRAVLVDSLPASAQLCRENAQALGFSAQCEVIAAPASRALASLSARGDRFDLIFADPPYAAREGNALLEQIEASSVLADSGIWCLEHHKSESVADAGARLRCVDARRLGDTCVRIYRIP